MKRSRRSVELTSSLGTSTRFQLNSLGGISGEPGRSTTTKVESLAISLARCHDPNFAAASSPTIVKSSAFGYRSRSSARVSAVKLGPPREISSSPATSPSTSLMAACTIAKRSTALATSRVPCFCHGSLATIITTMSSFSTWRRFTAVTRWPRCGGSNVPPNNPTRIATIKVYE